VRIRIEKRIIFREYSRGNREIGIFQDYVFLRERDCGDEDLFCDTEKLREGENFFVEFCFGREDFEL